MRMIVVGWLVLTVAGCDQAGTASSEGHAPTPAESTGTVRGSLRPSSAQPTREDTLTGRLGADDVEGGCGYLETDAGTRYEVIYPRGWRLTVSPLQLTDPEGDVVARGGDEVTVRGSETTEIASICQIGPIFQAASVER
jgi:hypothetical protein